MPPATIEAFSRDLERLIKKFDVDKTHYLSKSYNEAQARVDFISPFFKALGWDMENEQGLPHHSPGSRRRSRRGHSRPPGLRFPRRSPNQILRRGQSSLRSPRPRPPHHAGQKIRLEHQASLLRPSHRLRGIPLLRRLHHSRRAQTRRRLAPELPLHRLPSQHSQALGFFARARRRRFPRSLAPARPPHPAPPHPRRHRF